MIPITRKELYLNKIVGNNEYETPEKPISEEEFFFAEILGEAVQAPEPLTRYQIYLAKIAGKDVEIPYPETRLEYFLAKAAGMDITVPVPITREEIYWSNYTAIVEFEFEGVPPLTYKAIEGTLENYRIYGNTVDSAGVGDLVESGEHAGEYKVDVTVEGKNLWDENIEQLSNLSKNNDIYIFDTLNTTVAQVIRLPFSITKDGTYTISFDAQSSADSIMVVDGQPDSIYSGIEADATFLVTEQETRYSIIRHLETRNTDVRIFRSAATSGRNNTVYISKIQLEYGGAATPYEPYHAPVTTPIYLPEQIKMVGDEAEYIDYAEQKMHRIGADDLDVTLPALPTLPGTNVLSVGTAVQPSKVYVKGTKEREYT